MNGRLRLILSSLTDGDLQNSSESRSGAQGRRYRRFKFLGFLTLTTSGNLSQFRLLPAPLRDDLVSLTPQLLRKGNATWANQELTSLNYNSRSRIRLITICQSGFNNGLVGTISTREFHYCPSLLLNQADLQPLNEGHYELMEQSHLG